MSEIVHHFSEWTQIHVHPSTGIVSESTEVRITCGAVEGEAEDLWKNVTCLACKATKKNKTRNV